MRISEAGGAGAALGLDAMELQQAPPGEMNARFEPEPSFAKLSIARPFVFFIYNTRQDIPLFVARISNPAGCTSKLVSLLPPGAQQLDQAERPVHQNVQNQPGRRMSSLVGQTNLECDTTHSKKKYSP